MANDTGLAGDLVTSDGTLNVTGVEAGATVEYSLDGTNWSDSFTPVDGVNNVTVRVTDVAGNTNSTNFSFTFDGSITAPTAPTVELVNDTGVSAVDRITSDGSWTVGNLEAGATVA